VEAKLQKVPPIGAVSMIAQASGAIKAFLKRAEEAVRSAL
jgi:hypothetical protein